MKHFVKNSDIEEIELELTGVCNLNCYICSRNFKKSSINAVKNIRPLKDIILQLEKFQNLKIVYLAGTYSEPTLYPYFYDLLIYLNKRNIKYFIYTNASCHNNEWWKKMGQIVSNESKVIFTICGSTQLLHGYYRVGSNLNDVLQHASFFRMNGKKNDILQHILFKYNYNDYLNGNMNCIFNQFSRTYQINSEGRRIDNEKNKIPPNDIQPIEKINSKINYIFSVSKTINNNVKILCKLFKWKHLYINQFGQMYPCSMLFDDLQKPLQYQNDYFDISDIEEFKFRPCVLCSERIQSLIKQFNLDFVC